MPRLSTTGTRRSRGEYGAPRSCRTSTTASSTRRSLTSSPTTGSPHLQTGATGERGCRPSRAGCPRPDLGGGRWRRRGLPARHSGQEEVRALQRERTLFERRLHCSSAARARGTASCAAPCPGRTAVIAFLATFAFNIPLNTSWPTCRMIRDKSTTSAVFATITTRRGSPEHRPDAVFDGRLACSRGRLSFTSLIAEVHKSYSVGKALAAGS